MSKLRVPPPSFRRFLDLNGGATNPAEIFTTNRTPKMVRHVFKEKNFSGFLAFLKNFGFSSCPRKTLLDIVRFS